MADTVTVACKLPNGLVAEVGDVKIEFVGSRIPLDDNGNRISDRELPGGYGITNNVPKEFWDKWKADHEDTPLIKNGIILATARAADTKAAAVASKDVETGLDPLDPKKGDGKSVTPVTE